MKTKKIKLKAEGWDVESVVAYPLDVDLEIDGGSGGGLVGELHLVPPSVRGECHCISMVFEGEESVIHTMKPHTLFINMGSADLKKLAKKLNEIAELHPRNKPLTCTE